MKMSWRRILAVGIPIASILLSLITARYGLFVLCLTPAFLSLGKFWRA